MLQNSVLTKRANSRTGGQPKNEDHEKPHIGETDDEMMRCFEENGPDLRTCRRG